jgi:hypothetical protein
LPLIGPTFRYLLDLGLFRKVNGPTFRYCLLK